MSTPSPAVLSGAEIEPTQTEREHMHHYPLDAAVEIARAAIRREPEHNRISLGGAAIEAHAVESLIGHAAWLLAQLREARKENAAFRESVRGLRALAAMSEADIDTAAVGLRVWLIGFDVQFPSTPQPEARSE